MSVYQLTVQFPETEIAGVVINIGPRGEGANIDWAGLPTSDPGVAGELWLDDGFVRVSAGSATMDSTTAPGFDRTDAWTFDQN